MFQVDVSQRQVWRHLGKLRRLHRRGQGDLLGLLTGRVKGCSTRPTG
jgi:hypothetical protein